MRGGPSPGTNQNGNGAPQLLHNGGGPPGQNQNRQHSVGSDPSAPKLGVLSFEQARQQQQQQQQRDDSWAQPPPHPSDWRTLTPIPERSTRDSGSLDASANIAPPQRPGFPSLPPQPDQIQKQQSETSQDLPKLQTDFDTVLGEPLVMSPASHNPLHEFGTGPPDSTGSLGSKPEPAPPPGPDPNLGTHTSMDAIRLVGSSISSPLSSPGKISVFSVLPSPYSNQQIHPTQSTFSDIPKAPPTSSDRQTFAPPTREGPGVESGPGSPTPISPSRFQRTVSPTNSLTASTKAKTPEPTPLPQTGPHQDSPTFSPTPTTVNSPPPLTHTGTTTSTTSKSEYSGSSGGAGLSPPRQNSGTFTSPNHSNPGPQPQAYHHPTSQSQRTVQGEPLHRESPSTTFSRKLEGAKPITQVDGEKERGWENHDLTKEAGALYYMREIRDTPAVQPPKIIGREGNILIGSKGRSDSDDDDDDEEPSTEDEPRPLPQRAQTQPNRLPPEPSPLQVRRPSAQAKASFVPLPKPPLPASPPHRPGQSYQDHGYNRGRDQQQILAPQPQQPATSSFNPINTIEGDVGSPNVPSQGSDTNPTSPVTDSRRTSVIGRGSSGRPGLVSRPSGARDLVSKRATSDSISSHPRHNGQPQPRHPLPPHPESFSQQPPQFSSHPYMQPPHHQGQNFSQPPGDATRQTPSAIGTVDRYPVNVPNVDQGQHYDDNSDALAALTFLERNEAAPKPPPPPPQESRGPTSGSEVDAYDTPPVHVTPSDSRDDVSQDSGSYEGKYKSSFAPSKQAARRLAESRAQQAAHQIAVHRPGKSGGTNGKGKRKVRQDGWAESSDEEEDDEDEDDEDVDSDGDPVAPGRSQGPGVGPGQNFGKLSAQGSPYGSTTDLNQFEQSRPQRHLPRPPSPGRGYGVYFLRGTFSYPNLVSRRRSGRLLPPTRAWRSRNIYSSSIIWTVSRSHSKPAPR